MWKSVCTFIIPMIYTVHTDPEYYTTLGGEAYFYQIFNNTELCFPG